MSYKAFEDTLEALKEENSVNTAELQKNHLEGKIERSRWTVKKMILDQEKRCIEQIEALYETRNSDEAFRRYLEFEFVNRKNFLEADHSLDGDINVIAIRYACLNVFEKCLEAFDKAYETTKERP